MCKLRRIIALIVTVCLFTSISTPVFAASESTVMKRSKEQTAKLTNYGEYYGWVTDQKIKSSSGSKVTTTLKIKNSKWVFNVIQTTQKKGNTFTTSFKVHEKSYSLEGMKISLKKYSISGDIKQLLMDRAEIKGDELEKAATKNGWAIKEKTSYKNGVATCTHMFSNGKYKFKAATIAKRANGKIAVSYTRDGANVKAQDIKDWLKKYKA